MGKNCNKLGAGFSYYQSLMRKKYFLCFLSSDGLGQVCCFLRESVWLSPPLKPANHVCLLSPSQHFTSQLLPSHLCLLTPTSLDWDGQKNLLLLFCFDKINVVFIKIEKNNLAVDRDKQGGDMGQARNSNLELWSGYDSGLPTGPVTITKTHLKELFKIW